MKEFDTIRDIDCETNTGKLFFASMSILSSDDFKKGSKYGKQMSSDELLINLIELADYVFNDKWEEYHRVYCDMTDYINENCDEGRLLLTAINILTSDSCKNGEYGGHKHVDGILRNIKRLTIIREREYSINLII